MDLSTLRAPGRFVPTFGGNKADKSPFVVLIKPLVREYQLQAMEVHAGITERTPPEDASPTAKAAAARENWTANLEFTTAVLRAHVLGAENLTDGDKPVGLDGLMALLLELPALGAEVFSAIVTGGTLTEADAGN